MSVRLPASARREQLLDVALQVFARQGYHGTSMNDVAEAAGVTKPVVYQHFDSKRDLYLALLAEVGDRLLTEISKATAGATDGKHQTELGFRAYFRWVANDHDSFLLLFGSGARRDEEFNDAVRRVTGQVAEVIKPLITADIDAEHQRTLAHALVGLAEGVSRRLVDNGSEFDPDVLARQVSDLAWAGLRSVGRGER
jgi:AcrR family transcriptional regulator